MAMDGQDSLVKMEYAVSLKRHHHGPQTSDFVADDYDRGTGGNSKLPAWSTDPRLRFQNVSIEQVAWQNQVLKLRLPPLHLAQEAGYEHAWMFETPIIDSPKMLTSMLEEVRRQPNNVVDVETGVYYQSIDEILDEAQNLGCQAVVNATGLGAKAICNDDQLIGGRGVLLQFDRETCIRSKAAMQEELSTVPASEFMQPVEQTQDACVMIEDAPWGSDEFPCYMIVRGDTIVVGGSYLEGDTETSMRPAERERLLENARIMGIETSSMLQKPKSEWVGFRPYRPTTRVEKEEIQLNGGNNTIRVVHSYGTGGSGWTVYTGVAKDTVRLVLDEN
jgi:D-amino-acid oxidase